MSKKFHKNNSPIPFFSKEIWNYFIKFYSGLYRKLFGSFIGSVLQAFLILPTILLVRYVFDDVIPHKNIRLLVIIGIAIFGLRLINSIVTVWLRDITIKIINTAIYRLREDLLLKLYNLSRSFHTREDQKIMHARIVQDTERFSNMSNALVSRIFPALFISLALSVILIFLNWYLLLLIIILFPVVFFTSRYVGKIVKKRVFVFQREFEKFSKGILFVLRYMDLTIIQSAQEEEIERQRNILRELQSKTGSMAIIYAINSQLQEVLAGFIGIIIIIVGGIAITLHIMSLGEFLSFYMAAVFLNKYVNTITTSIPDVIAGNESMITLYELANSREFLPYKGTNRINFKGTISLQNVSFSYEEKPILENINLTITPGTRVAITGPNGAGKTTIINLILGLYAPLTGKLTADGIPYDNLDISLLRQFFGVIMQHPPLFSGTISENIVYGFENARQEQIINVSKFAFADEFIRKLPHGYETQIGEDGVLLSGGECQRLAIARALIRQPKLLILDEPTNHLDSLLVKNILDSLDAIENRPAILLVSHDMNVANFAETIFRLDKGILE